MLGNEIDNTFVGVDEVAQSILGVVETTGEAYDKDRGVVIDDLSITERGQVRGLPCRIELRSDFDVPLYRCSYIPSFDIVLRNPIGLGMMPEMSSL